jgi:hypothetical protein
VIPEALLNPFDADPSVELPFPFSDQALWTEYCYFFCYDPKTRIGLTLHAGREPADPTIWRATIIVYLPGDELLTAKYTGRDGHSRGCGAGPLRVTCVAPMRLWSLDFDGAMQRAQRKQLMREPHRDSPGELAKFHLLFEGAAPFWDMHNNGMKTQSWGSQHYEQICTVRGEFMVAGNHFNFDGAGVRDHSEGPRDYAPVIGNFWLNAYFPDSGTAMMAQLTRSENMGSEIRHGYIYRNDGSPLEVVKLKSMPFVNDIDTPVNSVAADPMEDSTVREFAFELDTKGGVERVECEIVQSGPTTYVSPSDELVGTDLTIDRALQLTESATIVTWRGQSGIAVRERIVRCKTIKQ